MVPYDRGFRWRFWIVVSIRNDVSRSADLPVLFIPSQSEMVRNWLWSVGIICWRCGIEYRCTFCAPWWHDVRISVDTVLEGPFALEARPTNVLVMCTFDPFDVFKVGY